MSTLEEYLVSDFIAEKQEIDTINRRLKDVAATFVGTFVSQKKAAGRMNTRQAWKTNVKRLNFLKATLRWRFVPLGG